MERRLGVGVIGLHEGRTMLVALSHSVPSGPTTSDTLRAGPTRAPHLRAVGGCDLRQEKIEAARQGRAYYFNNEVHGMHYGEFANYAEYFARSLLEGRDYSPDLEEGLETYCLMEAIRRSAKSGQPVKIAPLLEQIGLHRGACV